MATYTLIDGQARQREYPKTFRIPSDAELVSVAVGDFVKVGVDFAADESAGIKVAAERFWGKVMEIDAARLRIEIDNVLIFTSQHGLERGNMLTIERQHILDVLQGNH